MIEFKQKLREMFSLEYDRASNKEIKEAILSGANIKGTNMFILMIAIFIASIGLNMNSTAVIIGAMLISPLMGGIMAIGYGMATIDLKLVKKAFLGLAFQVIICIFTSTIYFSITPISAARSELLARTNPTIWDVLIAFFGGLAGIIGVTRKERTNVIPGVAIATALMPPLCTVGYGLATGSLKFIFGAFYLFFINSFFICVSTYLITRAMRIPKQSFLNDRAAKKVQRYIYGIGILTIIPSVILAYQIVIETVFDNNVQRYLSNELIFDDTQVVRSYVNKDKNEIVVALLGKRVSDDTIDLLDKKLEQYNLNQLHLKVTQTETTETLNYEDIQSLIEQELNQANTQIALGDRDNEIEVLKSELVTYKSQLLDYQNSEYDTVSLAKELKALYPNIEAFSIEQTKVYSIVSDETQINLTVIIDSKRDLTNEEISRIKTWLHVKTNMDTDLIKIYINRILPKIEQSSPLISNNITTDASSSEEASSSSIADATN